ncbi:MAG: motility protein A [Nitrospirae bacterium]|nr:motility protein A [Nitrospirota bacterium]
MDPATILGIVVAFSLMGYSIAQAGDLGAFLNLPAILIVIGGTVGACLIYYPLGKVVGIFGVVKKAFVMPNHSYAERVRVLGEYAAKSRRQGLLALAEEVKALDDPFFRRCMEMTLDGIDPAEIAKVMGREIAATTERHRIGAEVFSTMGTFAPAMGMIGTLIGLVNMLHTLNNPANIGPAMAVALLSTLYGALLSNLVFFPLSGKLRYRSWRESILREITLEGVVGVAKGDHPTVLEQKLTAFITPNLEQDDPKTTMGRQSGFKVKDEARGEADQPAKPKRPRIRL